MKIITETENIELVYVTTSIFSILKLKDSTGTKCLKNAGWHVFELMRVLRKNHEFYKIRGRIQLIQLTNSNLTKREF